MPPLAQRLLAVQQRIHQAANTSARDPGSVRLIAVSKTRPPEDVREALSLGQREFGENYLQEALPKIQALADSKIRWHFIGPIQSNKTTPIAEYFDWVHSVDRAKIARRLNDQRPESLAPLNICLQVNISGEDSKSGISPAELPALAQAVVQLPRLRLRGLMAIPEATADAARQHANFSRLRELLEEVREMAAEADTLSMGMSADMEAAIAEGATIVRIGTDIFGPRG